MSSEGASIRRRRACRQCNYRFTTYEKIEEFVFHIKKRSGHIEPYHREKALRSIQIACQKRPIRLDQLETLLSGVERKIHERGEKYVSSSELGSLILESLKELDTIAYIRFASVYQDFDDPSEFMDILAATTKESSGLTSTASAASPSRPASSKLSESDLELNT